MSRPLSPVDSRVCPKACRVPAPLNLRGSPWPQQMVCSPAAEAALEGQDAPALQRADPEHWQSALASRGWGPGPLRDWLLDLALDAEVGSERVVPARLLPGIWHPQQPACLELAFW